MAKDEILFEQLAKQIYQHVVGMENVQSIVHCMTRIRMNIRDNEQVDEEKLKEIEGVLGVVDDEQLQVIIGPGKVNKVAKAMTDLAGVDLGEELPLKRISGKEKVAIKAQEMKDSQKAKQKNRAGKNCQRISLIYLFR